MAYLFNSGWELYADSQYTLGAPRNIVANTPVVLTNDGLGSLTDLTQAVQGLSPGWDTANNLGNHDIEGQVVSYRIFLTVNPDQASQRLILRCREVGGSVNFFEDSAALTKGAGVAQGLTFWFPIFADAGSVANGIEFTIEGTSANTSVYNVTIMAIQEHLPRFGS